MSTPYQQDLETLTNPISYINDKVIDTIGNLFSQSNSTVFFWNTDFFKTLSIDLKGATHFFSDKRFFDFEANGVSHIFIPTCHNYHWALYLVDNNSR
jgi:Ulp1 family protease